MKVYFGSVGMRVQYGPHHAIGIRLGRMYVQPRAETCRDRDGSVYRFAQGLGVTVWDDTTRPLTVGERGVW